MEILLSASVPTYIYSFSTNTFEKEIYTFKAKNGGSF